MALTGIMSREHKDYARARSRRASGMEEAMTEQEIRKSAQGLAAEMNFRLLCEIRGADIPFETVLWVDSVTVTDIRYPRPRRGILSRLGKALGRLVKRLKQKYRGVRRRI